MPSELAGIRFIPAYAGNARRRQDGRRRPAVHPRIRGERCHGTYADRREDGSSPHTRGTPLFDLGGLFDDRFIPAYAGNADHDSPWQWQGSVHPRIRGERTSSKLLI